MGPIMGIRAARGIGEEFMTEDQIAEIVERILGIQEPDCEEKEADEGNILFDRLGPDVQAGDDIYYPYAIKDFGGKMRFQGGYAKGFPVGAVVHFTAGRPNDGEDSVRYGINEGLTFFVIGRTGKVYQNFSLKHWGYHAGLTKHPQLGSSLSKKLVGIEVVSAGKVVKIDENRYRPWYNEQNPNPANDFTKAEVRFREAVGTPNNVGHQKSGYYHIFTPAQESSLIDLLKWMRHLAPAIFKYDNVLGHDEIAVTNQGLYTRKNDPGAALSITMKQLRIKLEEEAVYWIAT